MKLCKYCSTDLSTEEIEEGVVECPNCGTLQDEDELEVVTEFHYEELE